MTSPPRAPRKRRVIQPGRPECRSQTEPMRNNRLHAPPPRAAGPSRSVARTTRCPRPSETTGGDKADGP
ncbi:unnamed protein product [Brassica rapa]|uniref:Uncharacterized protein n=1 Tax=Brassica campestris TaxID=3711 RepID=A0A8D9I4X0_BRACM|nr:unnamed protein product [Brassica rapa]